MKLNHLNKRAMKKSKLTPAIEEKYQALFQKTINAMKAYEADKDLPKFKAILFSIIDETPNVSFLEPEICEMYGVETEESAWIEFDEETMKSDRDNLKDLITDYAEQGFSHYQLGLGSASLVYTLFGDTAYELRRF